MFVGEQNGLIMDAPGALDRLQAHMDEGFGEDGEPLEGSMVVDDFVVWVRAAMCIPLL